MRGLQGERLIDERRVLLQQLVVFGREIASQRRLSGPQREPAAQIRIESQAHDRLAEAAGVIGALVFWPHVLALWPAAQ